MMVVLLVAFVPALILYYIGHTELLTLGILALVVAVGEHLWATRNNVGMELRA